MFRKLVLVGIVIILLASALFGGCGAKKTPAPAGGITLGKAVEALAQPVGPSGATLTVTQADSPIKGLVLTVPPNAYSTTRDFKISCEPVEKHTFGTNFNPVTPLISIQNGGGYAGDIVDLQIPVNVPAGQFAMAFYYDSKKGTLEGIPTTAATASSITIATRHFSDIVVSSIAETALGEDAEIDTGFEPGVDDWQFTNYGSYIAPGGHCAGQSITALWYYTQKKIGEGETSLYGKYDEGTRDFWFDDAAGYRFASEIQKDIDWDAWITRYNRLKPKAQADTSIVWKQFVYAMKLTGEPQFIYIQNTGAGGGAHAMVVYGASGGALQIADPNYPGRNDREIFYEDGGFDPYNSGANAQEILNGNGKAYDLMLYFGTSSLIDFGKVAARWSEFEDKTIGNDRFPAYKIQTVNEDGDSIDLEDGFKTKSKTCSFTLESDYSDLALYVTKEGFTLAPGQDGAYPLTPGNNQLGFYVVGGSENNWKYVDFKYFNVYLDVPTSTAASPGGKPVITSFTGPESLQFDANFNVVGTYTFRVSVEGGTPPYYYIWKGRSAPQSLMEGEDYSSITISPQQMRQPGAIKDGFFLWVTVRDSAKQHATWGGGSTEYLYCLKFTGRFEVIDGVTRLVENTWQVVKEP
jgi:hypothetical protein